MAGELVQRVIDSNHDGRPFHASYLGLIEGQPFLSAAALLRVFGAGMINQNLAHYMGGEAKEMDAVADIGRCLDSEPRIHLVHECGRLQSMTSSLAAKMLLSD